jgi:L-rhamnonate dehydratase
MGQILVVIDTDAGITGYGVGGGGLAGMHVVRTVLRDFLLGKDPEPIDELWSEMYAATLPFGRKGLAIMALSGVDLALWDVKGKAAGQPVARLLGGDIGQPIPTYITIWDEPTPELARQHRAFKLHVETFPASERVSRVTERVARARAALGAELPLMIDAWMRWDVATTLVVAEQIAPYNIAWIEEPLPADDWKGYAELSRCCPIPIAGGEHEFTAAAFADIIERGLHQVLQPDACWCGGLTELIKIYKLARAAGLRVCPHRGAEIWGLHAIAALDPQPLAESGRPWMTWVLGQPAIHNGTITLTDAAGFGVRVDDGVFRA